MAVETESALGFALPTLSERVYNESTFRHFLAVERARTEHSGRSFFLLLVSLRNVSGISKSVLPSFSRVLFAGLGECLRDGDFIGWYRDGRIAGAVLTQGLEPPDRAARARIVERVINSLSAELPAPVAANLRIRVARSPVRRAF